MTSPRRLRRSLLNTCMATAVAGTFALASGTAAADDHLTPEQAAARAELEQAVAALELKEDMIEDDIDAAEDAGASRDVLDDLKMQLSQVEEALERLDDEIDDLEDEFDDDEDEDDDHDDDDDDDDDDEDDDDDDDDDDDRDNDSDDGGDDSDD